ncbi:MAG: tyrosine-type recombinase/integrase [Spirochaetota bacterium]
MKRSPGYREAKNQEGVPRGRRRYMFDCAVNGRRHRKSVVLPPSLVEPTYQKWLREMVEPRPRMLFETIEEFLHHLSALRGEDKYVKHHRIVFELFRTFVGRDLPLESLNRAVFEDFCTHRYGINKKNTRRLAPATVNRSLAVLSSFMGWAIRRDYYRLSNPVAGSLQREMNAREVDLRREWIIDLLRLTEGKEIHTAIQLALFAGLRLGEIITLQWTDVDLDRGIVRLRAVNTKNKRTRTVALPSIVRCHLSALRAARPQAVKVVKWVSTTGPRASWNRLRRTLTWMRLPNGSPLRFHDLRHVFAQTLRDLDVPLSDISALLGHSDVTLTVKRYAQFGGRTDIHSKVERIDDYLNGNPVATGAGETMVH